MIFFLQCVVVMKRIFNWISVFWGSNTKVSISVSVLKSVGNWHRYQIGIFIRSYAIRFLHLRMWNENRKWNRMHSVFTDFRFGYRLQNSSVILIRCLYYYYCRRLIVVFAFKCDNPSTHVNYIVWWFLQGWLISLSESTAMINFAAFWFLS